MFIHPHSPTSLLSLPISLLSSLFLSSLLLAPLAPLAPLASSQTVVVTVAPPIPSSVPSFTNHEAFVYAILNSTNFHRASHNASAVRWNTTLANFASDYLAESPFFENKSCRMKHSGGPYGENLALGCSDAGDCVDMWAHEAVQYDFDYPGFSEETGHFTQLVWQDTTDVGCDAKLCPGNYGWYLACEYWPRGNIIGAFRDEVERKSGTVSLRAKKGVGEWIVFVVMVAWWGLV
ncbi:PR-1-like protein [Daldinia eschscholtzii]|nr:PR-1-like protein [Daldinia eschscholtzii]